MPKIVGIFTFMSRINFLLSCVEHGKSLIILGPVLVNIHGVEVIVCYVATALIMND